MGCCAAGKVTAVPVVSDRSSERRGDLSRRPVISWIYRMTFKRTQIFAPADEPREEPSSIPLPKVLAEFANRFVMSALHVWVRVPPLSRGFAPWSAGDSIADDPLPVSPRRG